MTFQEQFKMMANANDSALDRAYIDGFNNALKLADEMDKDPLIGGGRARSEKHPAIMWNDGNKVVQDHRDGTIIQPDTDIERSKRGLPVPWTMDADFPKGGAA